MEDHKVERLDSRAVHGMELYQQYSRLYIKGALN